MGPSGGATVHTTGSRRRVGRRPAPRGREHHGSQVCGFPTETESTNPHGQPLRGPAAQTLVKGRGPGRPTSEGSLVNHAVKPGSAPSVQYGSG